MAHKSKLLSALDAHRGRDIKAEKEKKKVKAAERRKRKRAEEEAASEEDAGDGENIQVDGLLDEAVNKAAGVNGVKKVSVSVHAAIALRRLHICYIEIH